MTLLPGLKLAFVPANCFDNHAELPRATAHIFYHRSQAKMDDGLLKVRGFINSELVISYLIIKSAFAQLFAR